MRELVTTAFETAGLILLCVAAGLFVGQLAGAAAGLAVAGVLCLACSALIVARTPQRRNGQEVGQ